MSFHCAVAAATHNFVVERLVRQQAEVAGELHQREHDGNPDELDRMRTEHLAIAEAIAARDATTARDLMQQHLRGTRHAVLSQEKEETRPDQGP
ncbi:FCD domain-containing protein [Streptomyces sp. LHD-70]|uniref:FCD domain-containing protein n=1 Tax=Streptomyces sp. LHD-70 TaxID=3072140 RepID=UPI00280E05D4|nr:FCD domain-containing protein [Streptomyces sp. LHD-70]MDQ8708105.1 FCD domain-containing protein [Streptomyces sp. LHD-70]